MRTNTRDERGAVARSMSGHIGAYAAIDHVEIQPKRLESWDDVDALVQAISRAARKVFGARAHDPVMLSGLHQRHRQLWQDADVRDAWERTAP